MSFRTLQPLFLSTPIAIGGLGLDSPTIETVIWNGVFTMLFFSRLMDYFGVRWVYVTGISACVPCFSLFPVINHLARSPIERSGRMGMDVRVAVWSRVWPSILASGLCYGTHVSKHLDHPRI